MQTKLIHILFGLLAIFTIAPTSAQITLSYYDYHLSLPATDTLKVTTSGTTFPAFPRGANQTWDLSTLTDSAAIIPRYYVSDTGGSFADSTKSKFMSYDVNCMNICVLGLDSIIQIAKEYKDTSFSTSAITIGAFDSIFIRKQRHKASEKTLILPTYFSLSWVNNYTESLNWEFSYELFTYNHAPCLTTTHYITYDSVSGYGKMRIKDFNGRPSTFTDVLQVSKVTISIDSYYVMSMPMSGPILTTLGILQGKTDTVFSQEYYRPGELTPLAEVHFKDAGFTRPSKVFTHKQRLGRVGIADVSPVDDIRLFPNPSHAETLNLSGIKEGQYRWQLLDASQRVAADGALQAVSPVSPISLPTLPAGLYQFLLLGANNQLLFSCRYSR